MADNPYFTSIENPRLRVELQPQWHTASLRYFARESAFARMVSAATGLNVPNELRAAHDADDAKEAVTLLAWRSPTETTLVTRDAGLLDSLQTSAATLDDGCVIDQTGGLLVLRVHGPAIVDLLARRAGHGAMPAIGESRRARFAEIAVLFVKVRADEVLLIVDRIYAPHLMASIRTSAADL
jgi:heterotetrameric sarcosine oxidase gamma subunit